MGRKTKRQVKQQRKKAKNKRIKKMENMDAKGISRKKHKHEIPFKVFFLLKAIGIVLIPIIYFVYSPFLALVIIYYIALYFIAFFCENSLNKSVIKSNYIKIPKFDSAIALIALVIGLYSSITNINDRVGHFANTWFQKFVQTIKNIGSLQTGQRTLFGPTSIFKFGPIDKPDNFVPMGEKPDFKPEEFSMDNIPVEFMFSQILSTAVTVLIFSIAVFGIISLIVTYLKIKKFNREMTEVTYDALFTLDDKEIERILSFGLEEDTDINVSTNINEKKLE